MTPIHAPPPRTSLRNTMESTYLVYSPPFIWTPSYSSSVWENPLVSSGRQSSLPRYWLSLSDSQSSSQPCPYDAGTKPNQMHPLQLITWRGKDCWREGKPTSRKVAMVAAVWAACRAPCQQGPLRQPRCSPWHYATVVTRCLGTKEPQPGSLDFWQFSTWPTTLLIHSISSQVSWN